MKLIPHRAWFELHSSCQNRYNAYSDWFMSNSPEGRIVTSDARTEPHLHPSLNITISSIKLYGGNIRDFDTMSFTYSLSSVFLTILSYDTRYLLTFSMLFSFRFYLFKWKENPFYFSMSTKLTKWIKLHPLFQRRKLSFYFEN